MKTLLQTIKKSYPYIIIVILLLISQALLELELPTYTSKIINTGISNSGIEKITPQALSTEEYQNILLYLRENDKKTIEDSYKKISKYEISKEEYLQYKDKYPYIDEGDIYIYYNKDNSDKVSSILNNAISIYILTTSDALKEQFNLGSIINEDDYLTYLKNADTKTKEESLNKVYKSTSNILNSIDKNLSVNYLKGEYQKIGISINKIQTQYIIKTGLMMIIIALAIMICACLVNFFGSLISSRLGKDLRNKIFSKVLSFSQADVKKFGVSSLITRSTNDINQIQNMLIMVFRTIIFAPIMAIGALLKVMNSNTSMTYIIALAVILVLSTVITLFVTCMPKFKKLQKLFDKINQVMREIISGIPVIRAFTNEKHEEQRFDKVNTSLTKTSLFIDRTMSLMYPIMMLVMNGTTLLIVYIGAQNIDNGLIGLGDMMAFIQYAMQIIMSFLMLSIVSIIIPRASVSVKRINEVMTQKNSLHQGKNLTKIKSNKKGEIEFKHVYFKYPDADEYVLKDISFVAESGQTTAFIGSTGSGKSTLINLIPRLFDTTAGTILVSGVPINDLNEDYLHDLIGYVPQKGILFKGSIEYNIKYGNNEISNDQMQLASDIACASDFINDKKNKYHHPISQGGTNVSGGQKQRLSIARAIAKDPDIYIFDDSFSALDFKTDTTIRQNMQNNLQNKTILIVGSRINTIMHANKIVVLDNGEIVGIGTHQELLKNCQVYKEIAISQLERGLINEKRKS